MSHVELQDAAMLCLSQCCVMQYEEFGRVIGIQLPKECKHLGQDL